MRGLIVLLLITLFPFEICTRNVQEIVNGCVGERKNELHVINSKEGADKTIRTTTTKDGDAVIGLSTKKDRRRLCLL